MILAQLDNAYRYNSDTLVLYDFISKILKPYFKGEVLDVGCGCGILGLLLKRDFNGINLSLLDIQEINLELSRQNANTNSLEAKFIHADFTKFKSESKFDLIISNPPFYHDGVSKSTNEHIAISRYATHLPLRDFIQSVNSNLKPCGEMIFCYDVASLTEIFAILKEFKMTPICIKFIHSKANKDANLVIFHVKKSSHSKCKIAPPLFMMCGDDFSDEAKRIFSKAQTKSELWQ
ncbi:methyltransferase [Campylobacter sp. faydin G-24]|uniref:Methyltransferase n=1 Tax=Campylobacter anatolicus TaxID=2829105 RepID=A0ABS5HIG1_9BACT|nr:methyltransferase [Campylobacter anatolicus]MBR8464064.1 methyltransferase [Campylobacter anatolicus]